MSLDWEEVALVIDSCLQIWCVIHESCICQPDQRLLDSNEPGTGSVVRVLQRLQLLYTNPLPRQLLQHLSLETGQV